MALRVGLMLALRVDDWRDAMKRAHSPAYPSANISATSARAYLLLPLLSLCSGSSYLWMKLLLDVFNPTMLLLGRLAVAAVVLSVALKLSRVRLPRPGRIWLHILVIAVAADLVPFLLILWSAQHVASSVAAVMNATVPMFTLLVAVLAFRSERFTRNRVAGMAIGLAGVTVLAGPGSAGTSGLINPGIIAVLGASLFYGFGFVYSRHFVRGHPMAIVVAQMLISIPVVLPLALTTGTVDTALFGPSTVLALLALGGLSGGVGYILYYNGIARIGPTMTSYASYLAPVVAIVLGWIVLGERIGLLGAAGIAVIIVGIVTAAGWMPQIRLAVWTAATLPGRSRQAQETEFDAAFGGEVDFFATPGVAVAGWSSPETSELAET